MHIRSLILPIQFLFLRLRFRHELFDTAVNLSHPGWFPQSKSRIHSPSFYYIRFRNPDQPDNYRLWNPAILFRLSIFVIAFFPAKDSVAD